MSVCKERPATLPLLDAIDLEPVDHTPVMSWGGSGHHRPSSALSPLRQASIGLGFTPSALRKSGANNLFSMGNFARILLLLLLVVLGHLECNIQVIGPVQCKELLVKVVLVHHCGNTSIANMERTKMRTTGFQAGQDRVMALALIATWTRWRISILLCLFKHQRTERTGKPSKLTQTRTQTHWS